MKRAPTALEAYEKMAEAYAARIDTKAHNAYYERPAMESLLPDVRGRRVLDAGCGPGVYAGWLSKRGADVLGLDVSPRMIALARERKVTKAVFRVADIGQPLDFLGGEEFDVVLSALALDHVEDWSSVFREFFRVLVPSGHLVFSAGHPFAGFLLNKSNDYFATEWVETVWKGFGEPVRVPSYRRPLGAFLNPLLEAGFRLERVLEPQPTESFRQADPEDYAELMKRPGFLCIRAKKPGAGPRA